MVHQKSVAPARRPWVHPLGFVDEGFSRTIYSLDAPLLDHIFTFLASPELCKASLVCTAWKDIAYAPHLWRHFDGWSGFKKDTTISSIFTQPRFAQLERLGLKPWNGSYAKFMAVVNSPSLAPRIKTLDLSGCSQYKVFRMLQFLPNLHTIILGKSGRAIEAEAVLNISGLRTLDCSKAKKQTSPYKHLFYDRCNLPLFITEMVQLTSLNLTGCQVTDSYISSLSGLTNLKILSLGMSKPLTGASLGSLCKGIEQLDLSGCRHVVDSGMQGVAKLQNLRSLDISECGEISDTGLFHLGSISSLQVLRLFSHSEKITEIGLKQLPGTLCVFGASSTLDTDSGLAP